VIRLRGSVFGILEELEFVAVELSLLRRKIETSHIKSKRNFNPKVGKNLDWDEPLGTSAML
jgi:hypothetical protein